MKHIFEKIKDSNISFVDVGWAKFKIVITDEMDSGVWGYTNLDTHTIYLHPASANGPAKETLFHEMTHLVLEVSGYTSEDEECKFESTNEDMTVRITRGMLLLFNLNKELMEILIEAD